MDALLWLHILRRLAHVVTRGHAHQASASSTDAASLQPLRSRRIASVLAVVAPSCRPCSASSAPTSSPTPHTPPASTPRSQPSPHSPPRHPHISRRHRRSTPHVRTSIHACGSVLCPQCRHDADTDASRCQCRCQCRDADASATVLGPVPVPVSVEMPASMRVFNVARDTLALIMSSDPSLATCQSRVVSLPEHVLRCMSLVQTRATHASPDASLNASVHLVS